MSKDFIWVKEAANDPRTTKELIRLALNEDYESEERWHLIGILHCRGNHEVLEEAKLLCESNSPNETILGIDVLAQLGVPERSFPKEVRSILFRILEKETDAAILHSAAIALGHNKDESVVVPLIKHKSHFSEEVRYGVVFGLLTHEDERAISALIELSKDEDEDVRNWATFGLGTQIDVDTPEVREALFQRLNEEGNETLDEIRGEALLGLAKRKDERVLEPLLKELQRENVGGLALEAAEEFADSRLLPALFRLKDLWGEDGDLLDDEIAACQSKTE